ncbi:synaptotagmin-10 [Lutzomyia longipalpis]|uniref:synaptotagmin-10 n=1 Tax=Lutzomyia longipalpis TaxID=7200 RepID=UPI0024839337|nr:synaptotagmin-10 [Lutzomyia longipalpis]
MSDGGNKFVCPSDRMLALRAKLHTGWCTGRPASGTSLKPDEQEAIMSVIKRNEALEIAERQRIGMMVDRLEKLKQRATNCGPRNCRLCGQSFGLLSLSKQICVDCQHQVCSKCAIELTTKTLQGEREIWLCKICSETREMWKKSGAWFFKGIPKYELPRRDTNISKSFRREEKPIVPRTMKLGVRLNDSSSSEEDTDKVDSTLLQRRQSSLHMGNGSTTRERTHTVSSEATLGSRKMSFGQHSQTLSSTNSQDSATFSLAEWRSQQEGGGLIRTSSILRRGSISSSYSVSESSTGVLSATTISQGCKEPPLGWVELVLNYDESNHSLDCSVIRARDLPPMDSAGLADPFCKINVVSIDGMARQQRWMKTKTVHKTRNPEFNETATFLGMEHEELNRSILYVVILDEDKYGHDFLGTAKIVLSPIYATSPCRISVPLDAEDQHSIDASLSGPWPRGQILISLCYNTKKRALVVHIKRCINLLPMDNNGFSDPFVKIQLKPDSHRKKFKTSIKWRNLNPVFNEEFMFESRPNDFDKQFLIITVWDKDFGKSNDFLGSLMLGPTSKGRRLKQWRDCVRLPDHCHEQWHCLSADPPH